GSFVLHSLSMVSGYDHALGMEGPERVQLRGFTLAGLLAAMLCVRLAGCFGAVDKKTRLNRLLIVVWSVLFVLASWKHGFLRADAPHVWKFLSFATIVALLVGTGSLSSTSHFGFGVHPLGCSAAPDTLKGGHQTPRPWQ